MQDHEELSAEVAAQGHRLGLRPVIHLMTFDLKLVPVAQEHGIYIVHKVGHSKQDVGGGQPVPERKKILKSCGSHIFNDLLIETPCLCVKEKDLVLY